MDRELPVEKKKKDKRKSLMRILIILVSGIIALWGFSRVINRPVKKENILIAKSTRGDITATLNASAQIIPEFEEVIICPVPARINKIHFPAGSVVDSGQSIIQLQMESTIYEYTKLLDQLELSKTQYLRTQLELNKAITDLETEIDIKKLKNERLKANLSDATKLLQIGGGTKQEAEIARVNYTIGQLELDQLEKEFENSITSREAELKELKLNISIQQKNVDELKRKKDRAKVYATRKGVVTWVNDQIGANINGGEVVARVADLGSYKARGTIAGMYAENLHTGQEVIIRIKETDLKGSVISIDPTVKNGVINFIIILEHNNHPLLRPDLRTEAFIVKEKKSNVILVPNGTAFTGAGKQVLFVVENDKAIRREVITGLRSFDYVEIINGINENESVIISDMSSHKRRDKIRIK